MSGVVVASSACSDATAPVTLSPNDASLSRGHSNGQDHDGWGSQENDEQHGRQGTNSYRFKLDPSRRNLLRFGPHTMTIPSNAICRIEDSGYGMGTWNRQCRPEGHRVTITVTVTTGADGMPRIDLGPDMRFDPEQTVMLSVYVPHATERMADRWRVLYCPTTQSADCVDESLADSSLATRFDRREGMLLRRIKHFSGYLVAE